jgi:hypothetical protein
LSRETANRVARAARFVAGACELVLRRPAKVLLTARMAFWVVALSLLMRRLSLPRVMRLLTPRGNAPAAPRDAEAVQARVAETLDALLRSDFWVFTPTCWKRAPVLYRYLLLEGIRTRVVFGMREEGGGTLAGHAWLERGGRPLLETDVPAYAVTFVFPQTRDGAPEAV